MTITLTPDRDAWRSLPELPLAVLDAFGPRALVVAQQGRYCALVPNAGRHRFAWFADGRLRSSAVTTSQIYAQTLEHDANGRALVIAGAGEWLYAVDESGAATCLGTLAADTTSCACWLPEGRVALELGDSIAVYGPGPAGNLIALQRFDTRLAEVLGLRCIHADAERCVIAAMSDRHGALFVLEAGGVVRVLAEFDDLELADVRIFLDETGKHTLLPEGPLISSNGDPTRVEGLASALASAATLPLAPTSAEPAPPLEPGPDLPAPSSPLVVHVEPVHDAALPPPLERLGTLTRALIRMLRAAPARSEPDAATLQLIRAGMPDDLRAYVHAWACHALSHPAVDEWWLAAPRVDGRPFVRELAGEALSIGTFASGEPILARLASATSSCEVVMIDEEGVPYRYRGLEGFLDDLRSRAADSGPFVLDAWT